MTNPSMGPTTKATAFVGVGSPPTTEKPIAAPPSPIAAALVEVALLDAATCAAVGDMSISWWHAEVAAGRAPQPAFREPRCTRWKLVDVRAFWMARAEQGAKDAQTGAALILKATKASHKARAKREAAAQTTQAAA